MTIVTVVLIFIGLGVYLGVVVLNQIESHLHAIRKLLEKKR